MAPETPDQPGEGMLKFGMGVFVPTLLTIPGVVMDLREGWVVGNVGFPGAWTSPDFDHFREIRAVTRTSCLFCRDSEQESAPI